MFETLLVQKLLFSKNYISKKKGGIFFICNLKIDMYQAPAIRCRTKRPANGKPFHARPADAQANHNRAPRADQIHSKR